MTTPSEPPQHAPLGPLEAAVMDRLWNAGRPLDVIEVHEQVGQPARRSRNTIQTTLQRLVRKGLASRRRRGRAYEYVATGTRSEWVAGALELLLASQGAGDHREVLAGFVDFADRTDASTLELLEALVRRRLRERGQRGTR